MRASRWGKTTIYEVRCPRCDVSFPVETRSCIHCGGPTGQRVPLATDDDFDYSGPDYAMETAASRGVGYGAGSGSGSGSERGRASRESPYAIVTTGAGSQGSRASADGSMAGVDVVLEMPDEPTSIGRSLFRSLGGMIWIILLIAFSLARDCGD